MSYWSGTEYKIRYRYARMVQSALLTHMLLQFHFEMIQKFLIMSHAYSHTYIDMF